MKIYGTMEPIDIMANMGKIDIPTYFVMGLRDSLIQPTSVLKVFEAMHNVRPDLAYLKVRGREKGNEGGGEEGGRRKEEEEGDRHTHLLRDGPEGKQLY
jgi:hypothetical protein